MASASTATHSNSWQVHPGHGILLFVKTNREQKAAYAAAMERLNSHGATVAYPVSLPAASEFMLDSQPATITAISTAPSTM